MHVMTSHTIVQKMRSGDLVVVKAYNPKTLEFTGERQMVMCYDPKVVTIYDHGMHKHSRGIKMISSDGRIEVYPVNEWTFDVL